MTKLLKFSVLAVALALGSSTYAHAETVTLVHGGITGFVDDILNWLFGGSSGHSQAKGTTPTSPTTPTKPTPAPEVDLNLAAYGFALVAGTLMVMRTRKPQQQL
jgi:hypothetical protein